MDIYTLRDEEDSPVITGYFTEGHQNIKEFIYWLEFDFDIEHKSVEPDEVIHGWATLIEEEITGDFDYYYGFADKPSDDAKPMTYFFYGNY